MKLDNLKKSMLLYAITDRSWLGESSLKEQVEASLKGGITFLQLREKNLDSETFLKESIELKALCETYQVPFVINDHLDKAIACDADGIHIGQDDITLSEARKQLGPDKIIGVSVQTLDQALEAEKNGANYLGVGAVFKTSTKLDASDVSYEELKLICESVKIPVVAIGGIHQENISELKGTSISGIAVISAIYAKKNIEAATNALLTQVNEVI